MTLLPKRPHWLLLCLAGLGLALGTGCDSSGSKRDSQSQRLSGTWKVINLRVDGILDSTDVRLEIEKGRDVKSYRLIREAEDDTATIRGELEVPARNRVFMTSAAFPNGLLWRFDFEKPTDLSTSVRFTLVSASDDGLREFLDILGISGGARRVEMDLSTS